MFSRQPSAQVLRTIRPSSSSLFGTRRSTSCRNQRHLQTLSGRICRNFRSQLNRRQKDELQHFLQRTRRRRFSSTTKAPSNAKEMVKEPSFNTLKIVAIGQAIPFIGFGFMDNAILILAGDVIDTYLGVTLGISTLCAAAIGNIVSDLAGIGLSTVIEDFCANQLKLPSPNLSTAQRQLRSVRFAGQIGMAVGMTFGCILGMFPLLFIDDKKVENLRKKARLEALFLDVVTEAKSLVGAESTCLYIRVTQDKDKQAEKHAHLPYCPAADGEYLYAMYYSLPIKGTEGGKKDAEGSAATASGHQGLGHQPLAIEEEDASRFLPLGKGIESRAIMTGSAWNIRDATKEPDFFPQVRSERVQRPSNELRHVVVVPVLDYQGRAIGVIRAMNKVAPSSPRKGQDSDDGFTSTDVQTLKALASHISVSLNSLYQEQEDEEVRLRDTILILKEQGIQEKE